MDDKKPDAYSAPSTVKVYTNEQIARILGCSRDNVRLIAKQNGIVPLYRGDQGRQPPDGEFRPGLWREADFLRIARLIRPDIYKG